MIIMILLTTVLAAVLWITFPFLNEWRLRWRCPPGSKLPPMPPTRSIRGHVELLARDFHQTKCLQWAKEYGPVIRLKINFHNVVVLNDIKSIRDFCNTTPLLRRSPCVSVYRGACQGLGIMNGEAWSANRKFCMSLLRSSGFAKAAMEDPMLEEFGRVADSICKTNGHAVDVGSYVLPCAFNNIVSFFYGVHLAHDHPTRQQLQQLLKELGLALVSGPQNQFVPWTLRRLLTWLPFTRTHRIADVMARLDTINLKQIEGYKARMSQNETKDFIMGYTKKIEECKHESAPLFTDGYLAGSVISFLLGGTLTTTTTIMWHMLNFANNTDTVQARVQREIDNVVGHKRQPNWEDRKGMPYTMACILEMQRWKTVAPLGVSRESAEDVVIGDFFIAKGTVVIPNIWAVHNDPDLWEEPATFKPERFLREDGSLLPRKPDHLIPFCVGRRSCPAETFATMEVFLMITCLLQKYRVVPGEPMDSHLGNRDLHLSPFKPLLLRFLPRFIEEC